METAYIGIGSNLGDRARYLVSAIDCIRSEVGNVVAVSSVYETEPWDVTDKQGKYLNMVVAVESELSPRDLLASLVSIEQRLGRVRFGRNAARTLDLDILFYGSNMVEETGLTVPHPRAHERAFVLVPLAEIAPDLKHPLLNATVGELRNSVATEGIIKLGNIDQLASENHRASAA